MGNKNQFRVEIDEERIFKFDLEEKLKITEEHLDQHLMDQPTEYERFARIAGLAKVKVEKIEYELEHYENDLDLKLRETAEDDKMKMTENRIKALVKTDAKRLSIVNKMLDAKEQMELALAAREAFSHRKDCLISLGANIRAQVETEIRIKDRKKL